MRQSGIWYQVCQNIDVSSFKRKKDVKHGDASNFLELFTTIPLFRNSTIFIYALIILQKEVEHRKELLLTMVTYISRINPYYYVLFFYFF